MIVSLVMVIGRGRLVVLVEVMPTIRVPWNSGFLISCLPVPVNCVVLFLVILALFFIFEGVSWHPVRNNCNLPTLARFTQPRPTCLAGKIALYTTAVLGNVRTHLLLRKLKPNNKEKNYAIYGTVAFHIFASLNLENIKMELCKSSKRYVCISSQIFAFRKFCLLVFLHSLNSGR